MNVDISSSRPLPDFLGIPWGASADEASEALEAHEGVLPLDEQSGPQNRMFTGGTFANKTVALWLLQFSDEGLHTAKVNLRPPAPLMDSEFDDLAARLEREYGPPSAVSNDRARLFTFGTDGEVDGSVLLQRTPEEQVLITYQHQGRNSRAVAQLSGLDAPVATGASSSGCFIATAACGDEDHPDVAALRAYRDDVLLRSPLGHSVVQTYYRLSPPLARWIAPRPQVRAAVRALVVSPLARAARRRTDGPTNAPTSQPHS